MLRKDDLEKVLQPYGLKADEATFLHHSQNDVYSCRRAGLKCIIRISKGRHRKKVEVEAELSWIQFLVARGVKACSPLAAENGELCTTLDLAGETYLITCFEHAPGTQIARQDADLTFYEKLGTLLGRMHAEAASFNSERPPLARLDWHDSRLLQNDFTETEQFLTPKFRASVADLINELRRLTKTERTYGPIHADVSFGNIFIHENDLWIIDFDNCEYGFFLQAFGTVLWDTIYCNVLRRFADAQLNDRILPLWSAFLSGYVKSGTLKEIDPFQLKRFFLLREAVVYVHYHRTVDLYNADASFKAGLEVMRLNVENQEHQVDFGYTLGH